MLMKLKLIFWLQYLGMFMGRFLFSLIWILICSDVFSKLFQTHFFRYMEEAGFRPVAETHRARTVFGTLALYRAVKPQHASTSREAMRMNADGVAAAEIRRWVEKCSEGLPDAQKAAFFLKEVDGETPEAICNVLGVSATNLRVMLHRARLKLRECLELNWDKSRR